MGTHIVYHCHGNGACLSGTIDDLMYDDLMNDDLMYDDDDDDDDDLMNDDLMLNVHLILMLNVEC